MHRHAWPTLAMILGTLATAPGAAKESIDGNQPRERRAHSVTTTSVDAPKRPRCPNRRAPGPNLVRHGGFEIAAAERPRCVLVSIPFSIHRDTPIDAVRCAAYLAIVNRANGVYLYMYDVADSDGRQIKLARGFVLELRRLFDVLVAPPTEPTITVRPAGARVRVRFEVPRELAVRENAFADTIPAMNARGYEMDSP